MFRERLFAKEKVSKSTEYQLKNIFEKTFPKCALCPRFELSEKFKMKVEEEKSTNNSPWAVDVLEEFLFYCCPQCSLQEQSREQFLEHALVHHGDESKDYLKKFSFKEEPIDHEDNEANISFPNDDDDHYESDYELDPTNGDISEKYAIECVIKEEEDDEENGNFNDVQNENAETEPKKELSQENGSTKKIVKLTDSLGNRKHPCEHCGKFFQRPNLVRKHIEKEHSGKPKPDLNCIPCNKTFRNVTSYKKHMKNIHEGSRDFNCKFCSFVCRFYNVLTDHIKTIHKGVKEVFCDQCGRGLCNQESLKKHIQIVHQGIKPAKNHKCKTCDKSFVQADQLAKHIKIDHEGIYDFSCHLCGKAFGRNGSLRKHILTVHEDEKPFQCDRCERKYACNSQLQFHIKSVHDKESRTQKCELCDKAFVKKSQLEKHVSAVHDKIKDQHCHMCTSQFSRRHHLQTHIKLVHKQLLSYAELKMIHENSISNKD